MDLSSVELYLPPPELYATPKGSMEEKEGTAAPSFVLPRQRPEQIVDLVAHFEKRRDFGRGKDFGMGKFEDRSKQHVEL